MSFPLLWFTIIYIISLTFSYPAHFQNKRFIFYFIVNSVYSINAWKNESAWLRTMVGKHG